MWKDPTDVTKRKPQRLRGTPANRFANIVSLSFIGTICLILHWYGTTDAAWVQRARARVIERIRPKEREAIRREMFRDYYLASPINILNEKVLEGTKRYEKDEDVVD